MTYLQLMIKVLEIFTKENPSHDYNEFWRRQSETREEFVKGLKLDLMYLLLTKINNKTQVNSHLLKLIASQLTSYDVSYSKTLEHAESKTERELTEDPEAFDMLTQIDSEDISDELKQELEGNIANLYYNTLKQNFANNIQQVLVAKPTDNIFYDVITLLPELFFTRTGYRYIPEEYRIEDEELRERCYEYIVDSIISYRNYRIDEFGREKFRIPKDESPEYDKDRYEDNDNLEEEYYDEEEAETEKEETEDYGVEEWVIDTQFTGYSGLYYSIKLISIVLNFIKNRQYDKLKKFIRIDEYIKNESEKFQGEQDYYTLVEILYDTRGISEFDLNGEICPPCQNDSYLDFFLSNLQLSQTLTDEQIGRLILYYFDPTDTNSISEIKNNLEHLKMRRILRPKEQLLGYAYEEYLRLEPIYRQDNPTSTLFNADVMGDNHTITVVVYDDNDETYIPDCVLFDYITFDCKENQNLTQKETWEKLYNLDKPVIFINTSYMFRQFEINNSTQTEQNNGAYLWAEYFYQSYRQSFWLRDKSRFVFIMSKTNSDKALKYKCGGLTEGLMPYYFQKNKKQNKKNDHHLTRKKIPPKSD